MSENIGRGFSVFGFVVIMLAAMATVMLFASNLCDNAVRDKNVKFVNSCASNGKINPSEYYAFAKNVAGLGNYEIKIEHQSLKYYPDGEGGYREDYMSYYQDEILEYMYPETGEDLSYEMKSGDYLVVTITKKGSPMTVLFNALSDGTPQLISNYSMMVGQG